MITPSEVKVIQAYLEKLAALTRERLRIERQLAGTETGIRSILALHEDEDVMPYLGQLDEILRPEGFTDAVRKVLSASTEPLTPAEVRERLPSAGFSLEGYSNPLASIHTILKRLARTESVNEVVKKGKTAYEYTGIGRRLKMSDLLGRPEDKLKALYDSGMRGNEVPTFDKLSGKHWKK